MTVADFSEQLWPLALGLDEVFGDWLPRLSALFGSWKLPRIQHATGDPDGYSGLGRRGSWERLVVSEWAVADAVPDEFIRRVAMREQLFLQLSRVLPATSPVTRVWLACDPSQLGAPRLAHLAILVVLRRRAQLVGGQLFWSTLHEPDRFSGDLDPKAVLKERTTGVERPMLTGDGERLVIGATCPGARSIEVVEVDQGLEVSFAGRSVTLELPEPRQVARWLTFPARADLRLNSTPGTGVDAMAFVPSGGALLVRDDQRVYAFAVPDSKRIKTKLRCADWDNRGQLAGVGWRRQRLATLRRLDDEAVFNDGNRLHRMPWPAGLDPAPGLPWLTVLPRAYNGPGNHRRTALLVRDARGILHALDFLEKTSQPVGRTRSDAWLVDGIIVWIGVDRRVRLVPSAYPPCELPLLRDFGWLEEPEPADDGHWISCQDGYPFRAVLQGERVEVGRVRVWGQGRSPTELPRSDEEVVGPFHPGGPPATPTRLLARTEHELVLRPHGAVIASWDRPIELVALGGRNQPRVAVWVGGQLEILDLRGERLLTFDPRDSLG